MLIFCAAYIRTFEFLNVKIEKRISQRCKVAFIARVKRYEIILFFKR